MAADDVIVDTEFLTTNNRTIKNAHRDVHRGVMLELISEIRTPKPPLGALLRHSWKSTGLRCVHTHCPLFDSEARHGGLAETQGVT